MKRIDEIIIIADYDCCYACTVWYKGKKDTPEAMEIKQMYKSRSWKSFYCEVFVRFNCDILLVCDGSIEYYDSQTYGVLNERKFK